MNFKAYIKESAKYFLRAPFLIRKEIKLVERLYDMSAEELDRYNEDRFLRLVRHAYANSPFYKELYDSAGVDINEIKSLGDIHKLPVVTKDMLRKNSERALTVSPRKAVKGYTSGSTGTPLTLYSSWEAIRMSRAYNYYIRKRQGFTMGERLVSLRGNLGKDDFKLRVHIANTLNLSSYDINAKTVSKYYDEIKHFRPKAIEGYPSSLYALALFMKERNLTLNIPLIFTSSESLFDYQRTVIEKQLGGEVFDHYGMSERVLYISETPSHDCYSQAPGYSLVEVLDDGVIGTSLINFDFPLIRYKVNDILEVMEDEGNSLSSLKVKSIQGRVEDYVEALDGSRVMRLCFVFKDAQNVKYAQIVQREDSFVEVRIVPDEGFNEENKEFIRQNLISRVGENNLNYGFFMIDESELIKSKAGKLKFVINNMNASTELRSHSQI